ncbi:MAG: LacI family DNA-binding transcriptional regulator [Pseudomonadota bacterium]
MSETADKKKNITIMDVARQAGVSKMTVSRVLNNKELVKASTRERIFDAMKELNFRPNAMARSLAGGQSLYVGLIYANPSYFYLSELLFGAMDACRDRGHHVLVDQAYNISDLTDPAYIEQRFFEMGVHAVIIAPPLSEVSEVVQNIEGAGINLVCIGTKPEGDRLCVRMDDLSASDDLIQYLIDLGHQKIGIVEGPSDHKLASQLRRDGFQRTMDRNKLEVPANYVASGDFTMHSGMVAARQLLATDPRPTAIFASNDDMAIGAINAAYELGLRVPEDVSIVGFDDTQMASSVWPPLTTVRQPIRDMASRAIDLLELKHHGEPIKSLSTTLEYELIVRASSGPPKE